MHDAHGDLPDDANYDSVNNEIGINETGQRNEATVRNELASRTDCPGQCKSIPKLLYGRS
jgi:hypothetical protein